MAAASTLAAELERRGIPARVSRGSTERVCHTRINNVDIAIHFPTTPTDRAVTWIDERGETHRVRDPMIEIHSLADLILESLA